MFQVLNVKLKLSFIVGILFLLVAEGSSMAKSWHGIVPLHSSRSDVYEQLGKPTRVGKYTATFDLPNEVVEFIFAKGGSCGTTLVDSWRVARDTVVSIRVVPRKELMFETGRSFVKSPDLIQTTVFYYSDLDEGVRYTVENQTKGERVVSIDYFGASADRVLSCSALHQSGSIPIFEQYGLISPSRENAILDNFAIQLLNDPGLTGKVVIRRGQNSQKFATRKLLRIKNYLLKQRRLPENRISAFELNRGRDFTVELYLLPKPIDGSRED